MNPSNVAGLLPAASIFLALLGVGMLIQTVLEVVRSPGYLCARGHWQEGKSTFCAVCGLPSVYHKKNPKCLNGHKLEVGSLYCRVCGVNLIKELPKEAKA